MQHEYESYDNAARFLHLLLVAEIALKLGIGIDGLQEQQVTNPPR